MAGDLKSLKVRIKSITSTYQLTKAMELVASAKIRSATDAASKSKEYLKAVFDTVKEVSRDEEVRKSIYMQNLSGKKTLVIVVAGDRGLAGGYNSNVFKELGDCRGKEIIPIGKLACEKYSAEIKRVEKFSFSDAKKIAKRLLEGYREERYDTLQIVYTEFLSMMKRLPKKDVLLPLEIPKERGKSDILFEPDSASFLDELIEEYLSAKIFAAVKNGFLSEVISRRLAMEAAGKNASEMLNELKTEYNRARQGAITREITEIVAGSEN